MTPLLFSATILVGFILMGLSIRYGRKQQVKWVWVTNVVLLLFSIGIVLYHMITFSSIADTAPGGPVVYTLLLISSTMAIPTALSFFILAAALLFQQRKSTN